MCKVGQDEKRHVSGSEGQVVNFVLARGFNHRQFRDLLMEADA